MNWKSGFSKLVFGGAILAAIGIAAFGFLTFQRNLDAMRAASVWMQGFGQFEPVNLDAFERFLQAELGGAG